MTTRRGAATVLVVALLAVSCSGTSQGEPNRKVAPGARVIKVDATSYSFHPERITIRAGENVAIALHSDDIFHDFVVDRVVGHVVGVDGDNTAKGGLRINRPGTYTFYCSVPGHRSAGMEGTIVVR
jgi:plastocyanin